MFWVIYLCFSGVQTPRRCHFAKVQSEPTQYHLRHHPRSFLVVSDDGCNKGMIHIMIRIEDNLITQGCRRGLNLHLHLNATRLSRANLNRQRCGANTTTTCTHAKHPNCGIGPVYDLQTETSCVTALHSTKVYLPGPQLNFGKRPPEPSPAVFCLGAVWRWLGRSLWGRSAGGAALGAATSFAVGSVAALFAAVGADRVGMSLTPDVGAEGVVVG